MINHQVGILGLKTTLTKYKNTLKWTQPQRLHANSCVTAADLWHAKLQITWPAAAAAAAAGTASGPLRPDLWTICSVAMDIIFLCVIWSVNPPCPCATRPCSWSTPSVWTPRGRCGSSRCRPRGGACWRPRPLCARWLGWGGWEWMESGSPVGWGYFVVVEKSVYWHL